jgi:hypothetical protein
MGADGPRRLDAHHGAEARPAAPVGEPGEVVGGPGASDFNPAVVAVGGFGGGVGESLKGVGLRVGEERLDVVMESRLVTLSQVSSARRTLTTLMLLVSSKWTRRRRSLTVW